MELKEKSKTAPRKKKLEVAPVADPVIVAADPVIVAAEDVKVDFDNVDENEQTNPSTNKHKYARSTVKPEFAYIGLINPSRRINKLWQQIDVIAKRDKLSAKAVAEAKSFTEFVFKKYLTMKDNKGGPKILKYPVFPKPELNVKEGKEYGIE